MSGRKAKQGSTEAGTEKLYPHELCFLVRDNPHEPDCVVTLNLDYTDLDVQPRFAYAYMGLDYSVYSHVHPGDEVALRRSWAFNDGTEVEIEIEALAVVVRPKRDGSFRVLLDAQDDHGIRIYGGPDTGKCTNQLPFRFSHGASVAQIAKQIDTVIHANRETLCRLLDETQRAFTSRSRAMISSPVGMEYPDICLFLDLTDEAFAKYRRARKPWTHVIVGKEPSAPHYTALEIKARTLGMYDNGLKCEFLDLRAYAWDDALGLNPAYFFCWRKEDATQWPADGACWNPSLIEEYAVDDTYPFEMHTWSAADRKKGSV